MNENIGSRVSRLISGSINALMDKAEGLSPELIMKESIREVDSIIDEVKILLGKENVQERITKKQLDSETNKHVKLNEQIEIAVNENRDDLAKVAISRQIDIESQMPILEESLAKILKGINKLENYIDALNAKKREMNQELIEFIEIQKNQKTNSSVENNIDKAEAAFNRVNSSIKSKLLDDNDVKLAELDTLSRNNRVSERLEKLKAVKK
ncbi:MAG: PspA/IM30 family protein [Campylobacteraceae bacterium]|nr:PspA/IM30 family protein [Campylobacteraceae bacterium]